MRKILWLDDQFGVNPNYDKLVNKLYDKFALIADLSDEEVMKEYNIVTVSNYPEFKQIMEESIFDVVILDIDGMGEADREERSITGFILSQNDATAKKTSIVVYSGQVEESQRLIDGFIVSAKNNGIEYKIVKKREGVGKLCEALKDIFDNDIWTKFPHIRKLIELEELSKLTDTLKEILQSYVKCEYSSDITYKIRKVLEEIFKKLKYDFEDSFKKFDKRFNNEPKLSNNELVRCIIESRHCSPPNKNENQELRDEHLIIPSAVMPREVKFALKYIWELSNIYHHPSGDDQCTINFKDIMLGSSKDILERIDRMSYDSFILFLEWYFQYNEKKLCRYIKM
jgi:hypothetical protein